MRMKADSGEYYYYLKYPGTGVRSQDLMLEEEVFDKAMEGGRNMLLLVALLLLLMQGSWQLMAVLRSGRLCELSVK